MSNPYLTNFWLKTSPEIRKEMLAESEKELREAIAQSEKELREANAPQIRFVNTTSPAVGGGGEARGCGGGAVGRRAHKKNKIVLINQPVFWVFVCIIIGLFIIAIVRILHRASIKKKENMTFSQ